MALRALPQELHNVVTRSLTQTRGLATHQDVVCLGGGVAGLALAAALSASRKVARVTLIEGSDLSKVAAWSPASDKYENRVSSITADSRNLLERIGAWRHVDQSRTCALAHMQVWDGLSKARIQFDADEGSAMAWLTENANLSRALMRTLQENGNIDIASPARVEKIARAESGRPVVHLDNGRTIETKLLIGADGFNSPVRAYAGIETTGWAYDTHAVVATLDIEPTIDNTTAFQRFLPSGPVAFLPVRAHKVSFIRKVRRAQLNETTASLVWSTKPAYAKVLKGLDGQMLAQMINAAFRLPYHSIDHLYNLVVEGATSQALTDEINFRSSRACLSPDDVPSFESVPPRVLGTQMGTQASFPLRYAHADAYVSKDHVALLGDAAHTVHPLAGQGLNLGLGDVASLSQVIEDAVEQGADIGSLTSLQPYARARYLPNHSMMSAIDKLHKVYSTQSTPIVWARSAGLEVLNELGVLKSAIMGQAGASGRGRQTSASQTAWSAAASGMEMAQSAAAVAAPLIQRVGLGLLDAVNSRVRR